jgi:hypothetical protein
MGVGSEALLLSDRFVVDRRGVQSFLVDETQIIVSSLGLPSSLTAISFFAPSLEG